MRINEWDILKIEDAKTGGVEPTVSAVVVPMSRKAQDMGHPQLDGALGRQHPNGRPGPPAFGFADDDPAPTGRHGTGENPTLRLR